MEQKAVPVEESSTTLEQFRQQWRDEVSARNKQNESRPERHFQNRRLTTESNVKPERPINRPPGRHPLADIKDDDDHDRNHEHGISQSSAIDKTEASRAQDVDADDFSGPSKMEPKNALEHYERAVEKETQGNLRDSLAHYRKAYKLDARVDQTYKNKHFPVRPKTSNIDPSSTSVMSSDPAHHSSDVHRKLTLQELIASYAEIEIPHAEPMIKGDKPPSCPIRKLPTEVLVEVLAQVAVYDPAIFVRLALVCKRLAYHVFSEGHVWKRLALGQEFGLASQQYQFATDVQGREAIFAALEDDEEEDEEKEEVTLPPVNAGFFPKSTDWRELFHSHPRIRYSGIYISTVNYTRAGGVSAHPGNWSTNVHIVTYYRYLRFFRDGTVISLLTTNEPTEVVHHLTKENIHLVRSGGKDAHPLNFMSSAPALLPREGQSLAPTAQNLLKHALRGRWRLCHPSLVETGTGSAIAANMGVAGDLHIETEGVGPRYTYTLHLAIRSGSKSSNAVKSNKLVWKGFWSYNRLTDDWSEFQLKNDKAFWFSRVKSYGLGY